MCLFLILLRWQMTQSSSGCTNTSEYKEAIQKPKKPHTHTAERTLLAIQQPGAIRQSSVSLHSSKTFTGKLWAGKDSLKKKRELREWNKDLGHSTSVSLLLLIHGDLCYLGAIPTTYDNILVLATSEEHRGGPHTRRKVILVAEVSPEHRNLTDSKDFTETAKKENQSYTLKSMYGLRGVLPTEYTQNVIKCRCGRSTQTLWKGSSGFFQPPSSATSATSDVQLTSLSVQTSCSRLQQVAIPHLLALFTVNVIHTSQGQLT